MNGYISADNRNQLRNQILAKRLDELLPDIMNKSNIDLWIVIAREHNEDPVMFSMLPAPLMSARRTTVLMFYKNKLSGKIERMYLGRKNGGLDKYYKNVWVNQKNSDWTFDTLLMPDRDEYQETKDNDKEETLFECIQRVVNELDPKCIGLNVSERTAFGDGISYTLYNQLIQAIGEKYSVRVESAEELCVEWLETRTEFELELYKKYTLFAHSIIQEGLSAKVIKKGITTTKQLGSWFIEEGERNGFFSWFNPVITLRRNGKNIAGDQVIQPGDLVHCDVGYSCLGYCYDSQANAYILKDSETEPPVELVNLYNKCLSLKYEIYKAFKSGLTGNEVLKAAREIVKNESLITYIFVHPIGVHGHAAGPNIGRTDNQKAIEGTGEHPVNENTIFALEMSMIGEIDGPDKYSMLIGLETEGIFKNNKINEIDPQSKLYVI